MAITDLIKNYFAQELGGSASLMLEDEIGVSPLEPLTPLLITPIASPFIRRKERSFPLYRKPPEQRGIIPEYEEQEQDGGDDFEKVEIEDLPTSLESLLGDTSKEGVVNVFNREFQAGPVVTKSTFGVKQTFNPGRFMGQFTSMATVGMPLPGFSASYLGEKNLQQLQYVQAMAGLGRDGYGIGVVNGQVVGVTPSHVVGTVPNASPEDLKRIRETLVGKSGPMRAGIEAMQTKFAPSATTNAAEKKFQDEIIKSKLSDDIKSQILGFDPSGAFSPGRLQSQFGQYTPPSYRASVGLDQFIKDKEEAEENRKVGGSLEGVGGFIPEQGPSLPPVDISGADKNITELETDITPVASLTQASQIQPSGYVSDESGDEPEGPSGGGFGGGGWTAYGGRISRAYGGGESKGFASKTPNTVTVKGVGLIKPEETFLRTDMVDDRYAFDARDGDYVVNGPASERFKKPLLVLAQLGINNLKNKGVDIRVGNPKISSKDKVPLITASSENYFPKEIVENINPNDPEEGYRILDAINNIGKPEVEQLKNKLDSTPTDKSKYKAYNGGSIFKDNRKGTMLFNQPVMDITNPYIDRAYDAFVPGVSDEPIPMKPDDERFFGDFTLGNIKKALFEKEMKGYEDKGYIFTGVKPDFKNKKSSSAFGTMQITYSTLEDFKKRSKQYKQFTEEEQKYVNALIQQGKDKVNLDLHKAIYRNNKKIPIKNLSSNTVKKLKGLKQGVISQKLHQKYYDKVADAVIRQKLKDYENKGINEFLKSYGEGQEYADDVENILLDKIQFVDKKDLKMN